MLCVQDKTCKFFLPLSVITPVINVLNGIWRRHLLSNKVRQTSCPLILDNNHSKFSAICVRFMYKYFFPFFNPTPFVFFKDISCFKCVRRSFALLLAQFNYCSYVKLFRWDAICNASLHFTYSIKTPIANICVYSMTS